MFQRRCEGEPLGQVGQVVDVDRTETREDDWRKTRLTALPSPVDVDSATTPLPHRFTSHLFALTVDECWVCSLSPRSLLELSSRARKERNTHPSHPPTLPRPLVCLGYGLSVALVPLYISASEDGARGEGRNRLACWCFLSPGEG